MMAIDWERTNDTCMLRLDSIGYSLSPSLRTFSQLGICWKVENKSQHKYIRYSVKKHSIMLNVFLSSHVCQLHLMLLFCYEFVQYPVCVYGNYNINTSLRTQPIAASSRSTIWSGGNGLRWVPPS